MAENEKKDDAAISTAKQKPVPAKPENAKLTSISENFALKIEKKDDN